MDLVATKVIVSILFGAIRFFFGILPIKLYRYFKKWEHEDDTATFINKKRHSQMTCAIALCQSFGGGVLFATCLLHMMPEVYRSVEELKLYSQMHTKYPLSQLTICLGFFFVYFTEEVTHWFITKIPQEPCTLNNSKPPSRINTPHTGRIAPEKEEKNGLFIIDNEVKQFKEDEKSNIDNTEVEDIDTLSLNSSVKQENEKNDSLNEETREALELEKEIEDSTIKTEQQIFRGILVILALSLHSIFEGLAIGLQHSAANIWYLFIAVSIHSATILFCMGLELLLSGTKMQIIFIHIFVLSLTSPMGILIGLVITLTTDMNTKAKTTAIVLLEGISAGTILYITFFEVLNREKHRRVYRLRRGLCILGGFGLMALLQLAEV